MKELFTNPEIEIISYEAVDIICASTGTGADGNGENFGGITGPDRNLNVD